MQNEVHSCAVPTCVETGYKLHLFPTVFWEQMETWILYNSIQYIIYLEIGYKKKPENLFLFNVTVLQAMWGVELLEEATNLKAFWKLKKVKTHTWC